MYYIIFSIIYLIGWISAIYLIHQKINNIYHKYKELTNKEPKLHKIDSKTKLENLVKHILLQIRISNFRTKLMHSSIFLYWTLFLISPIFLTLPKIFTWILDISLLLGIIGIILALARRYILKVPRLIISSTKDRFLNSHILLTLNILFLIFFSYFSIYPEGLLLYSLKSYFKIETNIFAQIIFGTLWLGSLLLFLSKIDQGKLYHIILGPLNVIQTNPKDFSLNNIDIEQSLGLGEIKDLEFKDFIEIYSCTECGRCQEACPAFLSSQPLSPKSILVGLIDYIQNKGKLEDYLKPESIWSCTTCSACYNSCPVLINPLKKIIDIRRNLVMEKGEIPIQLQEALNSIEIRNHPFKGSPISKLEWTKNLKIKIIENPEEIESVDYIYWVGCAINYNEIQQIAIKLVNILNKANIRVGVLKNESCTGDPAKRIGNEYLFQIQAEKNIQLLQNYNKKIITTCPHCYNIIKNEYPSINPSFKPEIYHHSQIISSLIKSGKIKVKKKSLKITFHDPCYLGRQNGIVQEPRYILNNSYNLQEMEYNKTNSFCCGAGGGMYWLEKKEYPKINHKRLDQAIKVANNIATACPFCLMMLQDAANTKGLKNQISIKDIVEFIEQ